MSIVKWRDLSWTDFRDMKKDDVVVVLPIGSTEQHGPHLPVGTDGFSGEKLAQEVCARLDDVKTLLLPLIWCSKSNEHIDFPGTILFSRQTLASVIEDICTSVVRAGFKRMVIINWHGGNTDLLSVLSVDMHQKYGLSLFVIDIVKLFASAAPDWIQKGSYDIHAGRIETSIMLANYPDLVKKVDFSMLGSDFSHGRMSKLYKDYRHLTPEGGSILMGWKSSELSADGVIGNPAGSNAAQGKELFDRWVDIACDFMREIATFNYE